MSSPGTTTLLFLPCLVFLVLSFGGRVCSGSGIFGFDIHHRFSDPVKALFDDADSLPEKGSALYYKAMAHRDRLIHGRRLAGSTNTLTPLTFFNGNDTVYLTRLGFLHYANVTLGTPSAWYLVALDTGSDLFWLPCDCKSCIKSLNTTSGKLDLNIYSPNTSTTSSKVPCSSSLCERQASCPSALSTCPYRVDYLAPANTSSSGVLVEDLLHLITDDNQYNPVDARVTFGCGQVETGGFLRGGSPNGLLGLGLDKISVPSILASQGLAANSFAMCFGPDGIGRISFGDNGTSGQRQTPFNLDSTLPTYNITITEVIVGGIVRNFEFTAIFDSGTSFTLLTDPAYTFIGETFNSNAQEKRHGPDPNIPFEYCYELSPTQTGFSIPTINLTMNGGNIFDVTSPVELILIANGSYVWCLAIIKSSNINIIGQNFMTGYRVIFDREKSVLGWIPSDCYSAVNSTSNVDVHTNSTAVPPAVASAPAQVTNVGSPSSPTPPPPGASISTRSSLSKPFTFLIVILSLALALV